jgi:hypothetical protein
MKKGDWAILNVPEEELEEGQGIVECGWDEMDADISNTAQGEAWIRKYGTEGSIYMIVTCRAKVRCAKRPVDKFVTVCEDVE